jgi:hypothetical protein
MHKYSKQCNIYLFIGVNINRYKKERINNDNKYFLQRAEKQIKCLNNALHNISSGNDTYACMLG